jgi:hypothetical protein
VKSKESILNKIAEIESYIKKIGADDSEAEILQGHIELLKWVEDGEEPIYGHRDDLIAKARRSYKIVKTSASGGKSDVRDVEALIKAIADVPKGKYVVWSNDDAAVMYVEDSAEMADSAESCGGDYSSVVVEVL